MRGCWCFSILHHRASIRKEAQKREEILKAGPQVLVQTARSSPGEKTLILQAEVRPFAVATVYAKVSGYLREIRVDKGDRVTANQIMAVIEAPEIHRQYQAAVADEKNKWATARRAKNLVGPGVISVQEADLAMAQAQVSEANRKAQETQLAYEVLRAPFDGTVTARFADRGALVQNATNAQTGALPVVTVAQLDRLRVYVYLAQSDAAFVKVGDAAVVRVPERLGKTYLAQVTRVSGELDSRTRMMLTELDLDNSKGEILPGSFIEVSLKIQTPRYVEVPSEALVLRGDKTLAAVVTPENKVHFQEVKVGYDDGQVVRLISGLNAGQKVAMNLGDAVAEGKNVRPIEPPPKSGGQQGAPKDNKDGNNKDGNNKDASKGQDTKEQRGASQGQPSQPAPNK